MGHHVAPPNILIFICDQLTHRAVGAYESVAQPVTGTAYDATPNIDALARDGVAFASAYTSCPLCMPSRAAFWTGRFPHETGVVSNGSRCYHPRVPAALPTLGETFSAAGYDARHYGKTHDHGALRAFRSYVQLAEPVEEKAPWLLAKETFIDRSTTEQVVHYLSKARDDPFLVVADYHNPHNICSWVGAHAGPHEDDPLPAGVSLPPLPANFETPDMADRPLPVQYVCCSHRRLAQAARWSPENYRHYIAAYLHYTRRVDAEVGTVLAALAESHAAADTLVVVMADHGDGLAAHRMVTKQVSFYEEPARVPFIFAAPGARAGSNVGIVPRSEPIEPPLASLLDLFPTLCDVAGITPPPGLRGVSLHPWLMDEGDEAPDAGSDGATGDAGAPAREFVVSEWFSEWCFTRSPGRMVRSPRYKYTRYLEGDGEELFDLVTDPGELHSLINDPAHAEVLAAHRAMLETHVTRTGDPFFRYAVHVDPRWRSHAPGYQNHDGPCAPTVGDAKDKAEGRTVETAADLYRAPG